MLEHRGRKSGKTRRTVLEVVARRRDALYVAVAWKRQSQWLKNIEADTNVRVHLGSVRFETTALIIAEGEAGSVLAEYAAKHPWTFARLARFMLEDPGIGVVENVERMTTTIPVVELPMAAA